MKNKKKLFKKMLILLFVLLSITNNFAVAVSDNDGSAFISKAEFDSLKNSFQSQIANFNQLIDSKINEAIAAYLAGVSINGDNELINFYNNCFKFGRENLYWYRYKDASLNPMPVHFLRISDSMVGLQSQHSWASHILIQNDDDLMLYENRIMVIDEARKIFKGVKNCQEALSVFTFTNESSFINADSHTGRKNDNTLYKMVKGKKFNDFQVAIYAKSPEESGSIYVSYSEIDKNKEYMERQKGGISWITKYNEWGMKKNREEVSALGTMQKACVGNELTTNSYINMKTMYEDSYEKILDNFGTTSTDIPTEIGDVSSSYDDGWYYGGTEEAYWLSPMTNPGGASSTHTGAHSSGILNPFYDICCVYIGNLLDWKSADDTDASGITCTYQQGRPICKCNGNGKVTFKVTCHGTGKLKFYVNTRGDDLWNDIRGNMYGGRTRKWSTLDEYDTDYASWNNDLLYADGETKTITLDVKKNDYVFGLMCDNSTEGSWMEFDKIQFKSK